MATKIITFSISLLVFSLEGQAQFYDFFQNYQPFQQIHHTTKRPDLIIYPQENYQKKSRGDTTNARHTSQEQERRPHSQERDSNRQTTRKKHTTTPSIYNFFTTPKTTKKSTKNNRRNFNTNLNPQSNENNHFSYDTKQFYDENLNNIAGDIRTTTKRTYTPSTPGRTTKRTYATSRPNYATTKRVNATPKPSYATTRPGYATIRPSYASPSNFYRPNYDSNSYSTTHIPGVKPSNVDLSKPPITNRPTKLAVYPKPTDASVIRFPEDPDESPKVSMGPDEDKMSYAEKRRYIELAEKMCDKYKSFNVKKVEAIPLVPSPEPVRLNVSVCPPSNVPLVVGGKVVTIQEFPHMALLGWTKLQGGGYSWKCGGSLISDQYVLTASHCAYQDKDDTVVTGAPRVVQLGSSYLDDTGALVMKVLSVIRHPKYIQTRSYYDIALVKLVKPVTFSEVVKPACLGTPPGVGEPVIATGWGRTEFGGLQSLELRSVSIPVWDIEECHRALGTSRKLPNGPSADSQICAGEKKGGKDTCQGDSGGPAQMQDGCAWRIVAVTSVGRSCGAPNTPALYATLHIPFIAAQIFGKLTNTPTDNNSNRSNDNFNRHDTINLNNNNYNSQGIVNVNNNNNNNRHDTINLNDNNRHDTINLNNNYNRQDTIHLNNDNQRHDTVNINNDYRPDTIILNNDNKRHDTVNNDNNRHDTINLNNYNRQGTNVNNDNKRHDTVNNDNNRHDTINLNNYNRQGTNVNNYNNRHDTVILNNDDKRHDTVVLNNNNYNTQGTVNVNNDNSNIYSNNYYQSNVRHNPENIKPITNIDNSRRDDIYSFSNENYNGNNNRNSNYNNHNNNGYNRGSNYGVDYYEQPIYTVTEAPRFNNDRPWWQSY